MRDIAAERELRINKSLRRALEVLRTIGIEEAVEDCDSQDNIDEYSYMNDDMLPEGKNTARQEK